MLKLFETEINLNHPKDKQVVDDDKLAPNVVLRYIFPDDDKPMRDQDKPVLEHAKLLQDQDKILFDKDKLVPEQDKLVQDQDNLRHLCSSMINMY